MDPIEKRILELEKRVSALENRNGRFNPPTLQMVKDFCTLNGYDVNPEKFINHYESNGWHVGKNKMKKWEAAVRTWNRAKKPDNTPKTHEDRLKGTMFENLI